MVLPSSSRKLGTTRQVSVKLDLCDNQADEFYSHYEPKEQLGKGLSSVVCRCVHRDTNEQFAVKIIDKTLDRSLASQVRTEVETLELVSENENIIRLHEWFETQFYFFLVFQLAEQGELFDQLNHAIRFNEKRTREVMVQLLSAVKHIHEKNIVHRDVKLENILVDQQGTVLLSDFGFAATLTTDKPRLKEVCGTPGYMAPEVIRQAVEETSEGYGLAVDMWACGVIMYTMLAGFPPFWHRKQVTMLRMIMDGRYNFSAPEWRGIGASAKDLIRQLLCVNPSRRLTVAKALAHPFLQKLSKDLGARRRFIGAVKCIMLLEHFQRRLSSSDREDDSGPPNIRTVTNTPYDDRYVRCIVDNFAFQIYGHWVKRGEHQNRAAMFENQPKQVVVKRHSVSSNASSEASVFGCDCDFPGKSA